MWGITLDRDSEQPLKRQLYEALKRRIMSGRLAANDALPSTREMARTLNVSRSTVVEAYDMLLSEGFAESRPGAPTRVAGGLCLPEPAQPSAHSNPAPKRDLKADFHTGRPDLREFPHYLWRQLLSKAAAELPVALYGYSGPQGLPGLRFEIANWLMRSRGLEVHPDDIFITAGATHAVRLLADLLCDNTKSLVVEDPCSDILQTFYLRGYPVIPVPADEQGILTGRLPDGRGSCAVYVTPSHQFPLGGILPARRRAELIRYARTNDLYIIEDDYDSEFRYTGEPVAPLLSMDKRHVIYVGTFSKTLFPALRIGYAVLPERLQRTWRELRTRSDVQNPPFEQAALAEFLKTRKMDRHIQKMRRIYAQRRNVLLDALSETFGSEWTAYGDAAGLHIAVEFPGMRFEGAFRKKCLQSGVYVTPLETYCVEKGRHGSTLLIGYGHLDPDQIRSGVQLLADVINESNFSD